MTKVHRLAACVGGMILLAVALPPTLRAQAVPVAAAHPSAHVRFWKTELRDLASVRVSFKPSGGKHPAAHEIGNGKPGYIFDNYSDAPVGPGTLEVFAGTDTHALASAPINLSPGSFVTVLLSEPKTAGEPPRIEIIDNGNAADTTQSQITVRNFVADLKDMRLTMGDCLNVQFVSEDSFLQMRGLKPALYPLRTVGTDLHGKPFDWNIDVDFRQSRHQTLLIYPDSYGRIRPRLVPDGESRVDAPPVNKDAQR